MKAIKQFTIKSPEDSITNFWNKISKNDKIAFISGFLFCLIVHFFAYTNTLFVHDSVQLFNDSDGIQNGRFFINLLMPLISRTSIPWVIGLITSVLLGLNNVFITKTINITKPLNIVITGALLASFPVMAANHMYFSSAYIYVFAMLMATLCVYFADKNIIASSLCLIVSLSCYQAYLCFAVTLFLIKMLADMIDEKINGKTVILKGLKYIGIIVISTIVYYIIWKGLMAILNVAEINYRGYNNLEQEITTNLGTKILTAILCSIRFISGDVFTLSPVMKFIYVSINFLAIVLTFINIPKQSKNGKFAFLIVLLLPLTISMIYVINASVMHLLMLPATILPVLLFVKNIESISPKTENIKNITKWIAIVSLVSIVASFTVTTNTTYLKAKTQFDNSISYCTRILDRLEQTEGFNEDVKVVIVNDTVKYGLYKDVDWSKDKVFPIPSDSNGAVTYPQTLVWFLQHELNTNINIVSDEKDEYRNLDEVKVLEAFPNKNCMTWIDDNLILKIS